MHEQTSREAMRVMRQAGTEMSGSNGSLGVPGHTINRSNGLGQPRQVLLKRTEESQAKMGAMCCHRGPDNRNAPVLTQFNESNALQYPVLKLNRSSNETAGHSNVVTRLWLSTTTTM